MDKRHEEEEVNPAGRSGNEWLFRMAGPALLVIGLLMGGCISRPPGAFLWVAGNMPATPEEYDARIREAETDLRKVTEGGRKAELHGLLAELYLSAGNPGRDYERALVHLRQFVAFRPDAAKNLEVETWLHILEQRELLNSELHMAEESCRSRTRATEDKLAVAEEQLADVRQEKAEGARALEELRGRVHSLAEENRILQEKIEKLKYLDLHLEEKRRSYK